MPPEKLLWGADSYAVASMVATHTAALLELGFGPHLQEIFHVMPTVSWLGSVL